MSVDARDATFGRIVFNYLATLVPYWRISDEAWLLANGTNLRGIGVLRNYGGDVLVIPLSGGLGELEHSIRLMRKGEASFDADRRIVIVDDRSNGSVETIAERLAPVPVISWSSREELARYVTRDDQT